MTDSVSDRVDPRDEYASKNGVCHNEANGSTRRWKQKENLKTFPKGRNLSHKMDVFGGFRKFAKRFCIFLH